MSAAEPLTMEALFMKKIVTQQLSADVAPRTVAGIANASAEDGSGDALNWWQAANVRKLSDFLESEPYHNLELAGHNVLVSLPRLF